MTISLQFFTQTSKLLNCVPIVYQTAPLSKWIKISLSLIVLLSLQIILVLAAIFGIIIYRVIIVALLYYSDEQSIHSIAKIITSLTAAIINFIVIIILNIVSANNFSCTILYYCTI